MPATATRVVDVKALDEPGLAALERQLLPVALSVFGNFDDTQLHQGLVSDLYALVRIQLMLREDGGVVGYCLFRLHETELGGRSCAVVRSALVVERAHRGSAPFRAFVAAQMLAYRLAHPGREMYGFDLLIHPTSYITVAQGFSAFWPHWDRETPPEIEAPERVNAFETAGMRILCSERGRERRIA